MGEDWGWDWGGELFHSSQASSTSIFTVHSVGGSASSACLLPRPKGDLAPARRADEAGLGNRCCRGRGCGDELPNACSRLSNSQGTKCWCWASFGLGLHSAASMAM